MTERVSVVMTVRGEPADRLIRSLEAIASQQWSEIEVLLAAVPDDLEVAKAVEAVDLPGLRVVSNPTGRRTEGLNRAIARATGSVICRVDARTLLPAGYIERCVGRLAHEPGVGVVGGHQIPVASSDRIIDVGIARGLRNPYLLGVPAYRRAAASGPVDTVYLGAWRTAELVDIGGFDECLEANEDFELCRRFADAGWLVWLEQGLDVPYEARSHFLDVYRQYHAFGRSKVRYWRTTGKRPNGRQALALISVCLLVPALPFVVARRRRVAIAVLASGGALLALDHLAEPGTAGLRERLAAVGAAVCVGVGWIAGVAHEAAVGTSG